MSVLIRKVYMTNLIASTGLDILVIFVTALAVLNFIK